MDLAVIEPMKLSRIDVFRIQLEEARKEWKRRKPELLVERINLVFFRDKKAQNPKTPRLARSMGAVKKWRPIMKEPLRC